MPRTKTSARQSLLDAATVLLADNPGASFLEIAEAAGVGRASLYRHFPTREDLIRELCLEAIRATDEAAAHVMSDATSAAHALELTAEAMVPLGDRYYFLNRVPFIEDEEVNRQLKRQNGELKMMIQAAQQEDAIDRAMPTAWACMVFNALVYAAWSAMKEDGLNHDETSRLLVQTLRNGLAAANP